MLDDFIIGRETGLKSVFERAGLAAKSDVPVLLLGETGSGKEVVARLLHEESLRVGKPFLKVNCGAIPSELIDSYLFGHEKGAFTGAVDRRQGWFETADGGTLLLDEIGELPLPAQIRFLRVLQDGQFEPVGSNGKTVQVNVRIIAATHRNLRHMIRDGLFREDLWYRISVFPIRVPPLRERLEDIEPLAQHCVRRACKKFQLPSIAITAENIRLLEQYPWHGNVREFGAVIDRAVLLGAGRRLALRESFESLQQDDSAFVPPPLPELPSDVKLQSGAKEPESHAASDKSFLSLDDAVRQHIEAALTLTHGTIEGSRGAAALLAINPHTLRAKMRKLGIDWSKFRR
jgi:transcriptional regulator with GAF, ATPase, and Fis domain